jgi:hypothetical protein
MGFQVCGGLFVIGFLPPVADLCLLQYVTVYLSVRKTGLGSGQNDSYLHVLVMAVCADTPPKMISTAAHVPSGHPS